MYYNTMHKFILSSSDSFVTNNINFTSKNFGRDEILEISSEKISIRSFESTSSRSANTSFVGLELKHFTGKITGSLVGTGDVSGSIICCGLVIPNPIVCP